MPKRNAASVKTILEQGKTMEFWAIIVKSLADNIADLRAQQKSSKIRKLPAQEYKLQNELLFEKIKYCQELQKLPDNLIVILEETPSEVENLDPY